MIRKTLTRNKDFEDEYLAKFQVLPLHRNEQKNSYHSLVPAARSPNGTSTNRFSPICKPCQKETKCLPSFNKKLIFFKSGPVGSHSH